MPTAWPLNRNLTHREAAVAELVRKGSNLAVDGAVRWRRVDLAGVIKTRFNVTLAERGAGLAGVHGQVVHRWNGWHRGEGAVGLRDGRRVSLRKGSGILSVSVARRVHRCIRDKMPDQMKPPFALWTAQAVRELIYQKFGKTLGLSTMPLYLKRWVSPRKNL
jgi:hypothetical protein